MKLIILTGLLLTLFAFEKPQAPNTLTDKEKKEGWQLLFDGKSTHGWRSARKSTFPAKGWSVTDGTLSLQPFDSADVQRYGDIVTTESFSNFDLVFDFRLTEGGNSGVKYFVVEPTQGLTFGLEYQVLDDARNPDARNGRNGNRTVGSLYDLIPAGSKRVNPVGEWNTGRVLSKGNHVEHWLNGQKVLEYERGSESFRQLVAQSKYNGPEYNASGRFGEVPAGPILLQDHGNRVWFQNIKVKRL